MTPLPPELLIEKRLNLAEVEELTGQKKTRIYDAIKTKGFPPPEKDGPRFSRWRTGDVLEWLAKRREAAA